MDLKFLTGSANDARQKMAKGHETAVKRATGGVLTIGSGNKGMKGDVQSQGWMIECKATSKLSLSLKLEWLEKLVREAAARRMRPALSIRFDTGDQDWVLVRAEDFETLFPQAEP